MIFCDLHVNVELNGRVADVDIVEIGIIGIKCTRVNAVNYEATMTLQRSGSRVNGCEGFDRVVRCHGIE